MATNKYPISKLLKVLTEKKTKVQRNSPLLEGLVHGEKAILEDRILSHSEAKKRMSRWLD